MSDVVCGGLMCCNMLKLGLSWAIRCYGVQKFLSSTCINKSSAAAQFMLYQLTKHSMKEKAATAHISSTCIRTMLWERTQESERTERKK